MLKGRGDTVVVLQEYIVANYLEVWGVLYIFGVTIKRPGGSALCLVK